MAFPITTTVTIGIIITFAFKLNHNY